MALPAGVSTATLIVGVPVNFSGAPLKSYISIKPSVSLVHTATGTPLVNLIDRLETTEGAAGQFALPHTDQDGFQDENGNAYKNWYYTATIQYAGARETLPETTKTFQLLVGQDVVDLDLLPSGVPAMPWTGATAGVTSVNGQTGSVYVAEVTDAAITGVVQDPASTTISELGKTFAGLAITPENLTKKAANSCLYIPSGTAMLRTRAKLAEVLSGVGQFHTAVVGDSIASGAATNGASNPKWQYSWPGQLRRDVEARYGRAGTGMVLSDPTIRAFPARDPRYTFTGTLLDHTFGLYSASAYRINAGTDGAISFTADCDEFWVYTFGSGSGEFNMQVDGGTTYKGTTLSSGVPTGGQLVAEAGFYRTATGGHNVFKVPVSGLGTHTIKITAGPAGNVFLYAIEGRINGAGRIRVSNAAQSSKSLHSIIPAAQGMTWGDDTGLQGFAPMDTLKADLLILGLGINDWQGQRTLADVRTRLEATIDRQRGLATVIPGVVQAGGDIALLWNPKPDVATLGGGAYINPDWDAYRNLFYEVARDKDVALIDLGGIWKDYAAANAFGMFADTIHPGDKGLRDMSLIIHAALFGTAPEGATQSTVLRSPNGTRFRVSVDDDGALTTTSL